VETEGQGTMVATRERVTRRDDVWTAGAYGLFCVLGLASRAVPALFGVFVAYGIVFPLVWARRAHDWSTVGLTRQGLGRAARWGLLGGLGWAAYTVVAFPPTGLPPLWGVQVALAVPVWLLVLSPFQELFYRGWMQPRLQRALGRWPGLLATSLAFTLWHFFPDFTGSTTATLPLTSLLGIASTFLAGVLFGYLRDRTDSVVAPWLAHAIGGLGLVLIGRMTFLTYVP
jgi:membrane protease YdiL (CAAX protease family)